MSSPTVRPTSSFDPASDAAKLRTAMKGVGSDKDSIIELLGRRTFAEREQIKQKYMHVYGKDLQEDLKSELRGRLEDVILPLLTPLPSYLAQEIHRAVKGLGTNENTLIEILCSNDNASLKEIKAAYHKLYKTSIEEDIKGDTSSDFKHLLVKLATATRDEHSNTAVAPNLAKALYSAGAKMFGTDESEFNRIIGNYSFTVLRSTFEEYKKITGKTFDVAITSETSGHFRDGLLALYWCIVNRPAFFAKELRCAMRGIGTKDKTLIRIVISRSEIDLGHIKDEYYKAYGKTLEEAVSKDTSGDYKDILLVLIQ